MAGFESIDVQIPTVDVVVSNQQDDGVRLLANDGAAKLRPERGPTSRMTPSTWPPATSTATAIWTLWSQTGCRLHPGAPQHDNGGRRRRGRSLVADEQVALGSFTSSIALADFDGRRGLDAIATNQTSGSVQIARNDGSGTLRRRKALAVGGEPNDVAVGDFNGNGRPDAV